MKRARQIVAEFAGKKGKCSESDAVRDFVIEVVERLLLKGAHGSLRKWEFCLAHQCFTAPPDLEVPLKVKIEGMVESVWSKWYEFHDVNSAEIQNSNYKPGLFEETGRYFTIYDIPSCGARVSAIPGGTEKEDAEITIQGLDPEGREIFTIRDGKQVHGETIKISRDEPIFTQKTFGKITGVEKSRTCHHVRLYWQTVDCNNKFLARGLLSEYRPNDTLPSYRRFKVPQASPDCIAKICILGRVKMLESYHDNDILPVSSLGALRSMATLIQSEQNNRINEARFHNSSVDKILNDENEYYKTGEEPLDFVWDTSPGRNENLQ